MKWGKRRKSLHIKALRHRDEGRFVFAQEAKTEKVRLGHCRSPPLNDTNLSECRKGRVADPGGRLPYLPGGPPRTAPHHPSGSSPTPPPAVRHKVPPPPAPQEPAPSGSSPSPSQCPTPQQAAPHTSRAAYL
ncbi:vegetative cell wall protein gp1-like [Portunus trituberculatus]|uniref:vegetative cell wall protein gp1-like n=1 Tax=Portunus trituberculatus TaxID=210409 RepID=UPI001E1D15EB|nr:vegetative cell wall protein gp1-like [Portunus trituberculatus]